ncbi:MAG: OmpA family protein [Halieaceae bacterium]|nr:OmpA family protein [Halieaceae bacterium]
MKLIKLFSGVLALAALVFHTTARADAPLTLTLGGTWYDWGSGHNLGSELLPRVDLEFQIDDRWAAELSYAQGETSSDTGNIDVDVDILGLGFLYYFPNEEALHPYIGFGGGKLNLDGLNGDQSNTHSSLGAGFRYYLTDHWNWRGDARWLRTFDGDVNDVTMSVGIAYDFADPPPPPVEEPPPPVDSDGDGVPDDIDECPDTPAGARVDDRGCSLKVTRVASIRLKVNFEFDSDEVQEHEFSEVRELADFLRRFDFIDVELEGHTDSTGPEDYNQSLSQRRAEAVLELLVNEHGISPSRLSATGFGESQPIASNDTKEGRAENRRVIAGLEVEYEE